MQACLLSLLIMYRDILWKGEGEIINLIFFSKDSDNLFTVLTAWVIGIFWRALFK